MYAYRVIVVQPEVANFISLSLSSSIRLIHCQQIRQLGAWSDVFHCQWVRSILDVTVSWFMQNIMRFFEKQQKGSDKGKCPNKKKMT